MEDVILFDKTLMERYEEFQTVFPSDKLRASDIAKNWSYFLELTLDPIGWQAIWKIPRITCEKLNIVFPTIVLAFVLEVNFEDLTAKVRVMAVQDEDIVIPDINIVPLIQLWPTKTQDKSIALNLESTANALDAMRFFYLHIFMPWDLDNDDIHCEDTHWKQRHLLNRLKLYYDMKLGKMPRSTGEHIHAILSEARRLQNKREALESESLKNYDANSGNDEDIDDKNVETFIEIHIRLVQIRCEIDILENEAFREYLNKKEYNLVAERDNNPKNIWVVFKKGLPHQYVSFLNKLSERKSLNDKEHITYDDKEISICPDLATKLETVNSSDTYILNEDTHVIRTTGALEHGGRIQGLGNRDKIILSTERDTVFLDFSLNTIELENLTLDSKKPQIAVLLRGGKTILRNCKIIGDGKSSIHQGIVVLQNAELELYNCEISNFATAIVGNSGSKITIRNTKIYDSHYGLKIYDYCDAVIKDCSFKNCKNYGIVVETDAEVDLESGHKDNEIPGVETKNLSWENNKKGNIAIKRNRLQGFENAYANGDPTIIINEADLDDTVLGTDAKQMETS